MPELLRPEPKPSRAKRKRRSRSALGQRLDLRDVGRGAFLGHLEAQPLRLGAAGAQVIVEPVDEAGIARGLAREAHEQALRLLLRGERQRGADHPAVDVLQQVVAPGGRHELRRQHFLALGVDHAHQHVEHARVLALQARDRLLHQAEAVLHERRLDVLDPHLVVGHARGCRVSARSEVMLWLPPRAVPLRAHSMASATPRRGAYLPGDTIDRPMVQVTETDLSFTRMTFFCHARQQPLAPGVDVVLVAALEQRSGSAPRRSGRRAPWESACP